MYDSDDEPILLSAHTLAALTEFNAERDEHVAKFEKLRAAADKDAPFSMEAFTEDWNQSQFWYSDDTARILALELLDGATSDMTICIISAPSAFVALKNILRQRDENERPRLILLEHDERFSLFAEFVLYDFRQPLKLPATLKACADRIICDPPFLSEDCQTKAALTARYLLKTVNTGPKNRVIVCTGERMQPLVSKLYRPFGVQTTTFEPKHAKGLSNEFLCFANYEGPCWQWRAVQNLN